MQFTLISLNFTNRWSKGVVSWSSDVILHKSYFRKLCTTKISVNNWQKLALFCYQYKDMTEWEYQHKDLFWNCWQVTQYRGIVFNVAYDLLRAVLLTWLYDVGCPKSLQTRAFPTDIQPNPYTVPTCAAWISAARGWAHKVGAGGAVYLPVVLDSFPQLCSIHRRPLINRLCVWQQVFGNL